MITRRHTLALLAAAAAAVSSLAAHASELSYTYVDFQTFSNESALSGVQVPVPGQTVAVRTDDGDGISIGGSVSIAQRFYVGGRFQTSIVDVDAVVTNPFGITTAADNFDLIQSRLAFGYYRELRENFDLTVDIGLESMEYDFGSFAGENFDTRDEGLGVRVGFRWNPRTPLEVSGYAHHSPIGKADLTTGNFDSDTSIGVGAMWYFFRDLGIGLDYTSGEIDSVAFSMRFSFGDLALRR
jgi:hypothetical protein